MILGGSNLDELFAAGRIPLSAGEVGSREVDVIAAGSFSMIDAGDLLIGVLASGAGSGDPLRRDPHAVVRDVYEGLGTPARARSVCGVALAGGALDAAAGTLATRERFRAERLELGRARWTATPAGPARGGVVPHPVWDSVEAVEHAGERSLRCSVCPHRYGAYEHGHKRSARMRERALTEVSQHNRICLEESVLREFSCPGCATALAADVQLRDEPVLDETKLSHPGPERPRRERA